jgi:hypothetical protein
VPTFRGAPATVSSDLAGVDPDGRPIEVGVVGSGRWTLLVFLTTDCLGCLAMWDALAEPVTAGLPTDERVVIVTRDPPAKDPSVLRRARGTTVVMSSAAWSAYRVHGPPFYVLVDGNAGSPGPVATEGVAWDVAQIAADVDRTRQRT